MKENSNSSNRFARSETVDLLNFVIMGITVMTLLIALAGGAMWLWILLLAAGLLIGCWAMKLEDATTSSVEKFRQLRKLVHLRKNHEQKSTSGSAPHPAFFAIGSLIVIAFLGGNLSKSWQQFNAKSLPLTMGTITRYENVDIGLVESQQEIGYQYTVNGQAYEGHTFRFVNRPYRVGTEPAKKLAANWKVGNLAPVFYEPGAPQQAVVDNTFCKGDELFIGLNVCALLLVLIVGIAGSCWPIFWRKRFDTFQTADHNHVATINLSNVPLWGTAGLFLSGLLLLVTFCCYAGGYMAMGMGEITWLVTTIEAMVVVTSLVTIMALFVAAVERLCYGSGRKVVLDATRNQMSFRPEGFASFQTIGFCDLEAIKVQSDRDDYFRLGRTFSVVVIHRDDARQLCRSVLQRSYDRMTAVNLNREVQQILDAQRKSAWLINSQISQSLSYANSSS